MAVIKVILILALALLADCFTPGPNFEPTDKFEVWLFEKPVYPTKNDFYINSINNFKAAIGFYNRDRPVSDNTHMFVLEWKLSNSGETITESIFPEIKPDGTPYFHNKANISVSIRFPSDFTTGVYIMEINGAMMNHYLCWVNHYEAANNTLQLFRVAHDPSHVDVILPSVNPADFVWESLNALYNLGGQYVPNAIDPPPNRNFFTIWASSTRPIHASEVPDANAFFKKFQWNGANITFETLIEQLANSSNKIIYLHTGLHTYRVEVMSPYFTGDFAPVALGQGTRKPGEVSGCPLPPPRKYHRISVGSVLLIIFFCSIGAYFIFGVLYNSFVKGETGVRRLPNATFWVSTGLLVRDGFRFVKRKATGQSGGDSDFGVAATERSALVDSHL